MEWRHWLVIRCCSVVNLPLRNYLQWNLHLNSKKFLFSQDSMSYFSYREGSRNRVCDQIKWSIFSERTLAFVVIVLYKSALWLHDYSLYRNKLLGPLKVPQFIYINFLHHRMPIYSEISKLMKTSRYTWRSISSSKSPRHCSNMSRQT